MKLQRETSSHGKWYDDACGAAFAFELIGERWSALILREMMFGPRRFTDLRAGLPAISAKVLAERLDGLERSALVQRRQLPPPAAVQVYELTDWGRKADEPLLALCRWALSAPGWDRSLPTSPAAMMMSMRALFDADAAAGLSLQGTIRVGLDSFAVRVAEGQFEVERGEAPEAQFTIIAPSTGLLRRLVYGKVPPGALAESGVQLTGNTAIAEHFIALFALPLPAA